MRELSLNVLDIAQNSITAGAPLIEIAVAEISQPPQLVITIADNGCGMSEEQLSKVLDPFFTTRTTRKVGMGIPLFRLAAEQTGGSFSIESQKGVGTTVTAVFKTDSIDFTPLGDICATIVMLITLNTDRNFIYRREIDGRAFALDTREMREILGGVPLNEPEVAKWMKDYINEQTEALYSEV